jgi:hypothetical protein
VLQYPISRLTRPAVTRSGDAARRPAAGNGTAYSDNALTIFHQQQTGRHVSSHLSLSGMVGVVHKYVIRASLKTPIFQRIFIFLRKISLFFLRKIEIT